MLDRLSSNSRVTTYFFTLSLHDALPILPGNQRAADTEQYGGDQGTGHDLRPAKNHVGQNAEKGGKQQRDRKSTRLNSSHVAISYAVFCLKKKKRQNKYVTTSH